VFSEDLDVPYALLHEKNKTLSDIQEPLLSAGDELEASKNIANEMRNIAVLFTKNLKEKRLLDSARPKLEKLVSTGEQGSTAFESAISYLQSLDSDSNEWGAAKDEVERSMAELENIQERIERVRESLKDIEVEVEEPISPDPDEISKMEELFDQMVIIVGQVADGYDGLEQLIEFRKRNKADRLARERTQHEEFIRRIRKGEGFGEPTEDAARSRAKQEEEEAARRKEQENRKLVGELQELRKDPLMFKVYHSWKTKYLNCVHDHRFLEFDNVGGWQCFQHALPYDTTERVWPCCDNSFEHQGCVRADHRTRDTPYSDEQTITTLHRVIVKRLGANRHGFRAPSSYVRYDRDEHQRRIREASMRAQSRQKFQFVNRNRGADTVDILMPRLLRFDLSSNGEIIIEDKEDIWLWSWDPKNRPYIITFPTLSNTFAYVFEKTERTIWIKVAELVRDVELLFKGGRYGVYYHRHPRSPIEFTPIERVVQWEESSA
jgi:hypothetical protein